MRDGDAVADGGTADVLAVAQAAEDALGAGFAAGEQAGGGAQGAVAVGGREYPGTHGRHQVIQGHDCNGR